MAQLALSIVGAGVGAVIGSVIPGVGTALGAQIGWAAGSVGGSMLFAPDAKKQIVTGARLDNLAQQVSTYGAPIPKLYGTMRLGGNVIWQTDIAEFRNQDTETHGGKGGGGGQKTVTVTYTYILSLAIGLCKGEIDGIEKIWADNKLIYLAGEGGYLDWVLYQGTETQEVDSVIESYEGKANANRGLAYIVFENFDITEYGHIPIFSFLVVTGSRTPTPDDRIHDIRGKVLAAGGSLAYDPYLTQVYFPAKEKVVTCYAYDPLNLPFGRYDGESNPVIQPGSSYHVCDPEYLVYVPPGVDENEIPTSNPCVIGVEGCPGGIGWFNVIKILPEVKSSKCFEMYIAPTYPYHNVFEDTGPNPNGANREDCNSSWDVEDWPWTTFGNRMFMWLGPVAPRTRQAGITGIPEPNYERCPNWTPGDPTYYIKSFGAQGGKDGSLIVAFNANGGWSNPGPYPFCTVDLGPGSYACYGSLPRVDGIENVTSFFGKLILFALELGHVAGKRGELPIIYGGDTWAISFDYQWVYCVDSLPTRSSGPYFDGGFVTQTNLPNFAGLSLQPSYDWRRGLVFFGVRNPSDSMMRCYYGKFSFNYIELNYNRAFSTQVASCYNQDRDKWYIFAGTSLFEIEPPTEDSPPSPPVVLRRVEKGHQCHLMISIPGISAYAFGQSSSYTYRIWLDEGPYTDTPPTLAEVVTDICLQTALTEGDIDVTDLTTVYVDGYVVNQQVPATSALNDLMNAYLFDYFMCDGKIVFRRKESAFAAATIPSTDFYPVEGSSLVTLSRKPDKALPDVVQLTHVSAEQQYNIGTKFARRNATYASDVKTIDLPLCLTDVDAQQLVEKAMGIVWTERTQVTFSLGWKYLYLSVGDRVVLQTDTTEYTVYITDMDMSTPGVINFTANSYDVQSYESNNTGSGPTWVGYSSSSIGSKVFLMDIPQLSDSYDGFGYYIAAGPIDSTPGTWKGALIYTSMDGVVFNQEMMLDSPVSHGVALTVLGTTPDTNIWDHGNTVSIQMNYGTLASVTEEEVLNGANAFLLGSELIQAKDCVLQGDGSYLLSGLVRGRKGTEGYVGSHEANERFVVLSTATVYPVLTSTSYLDVPLRVRVYTIDSVVSSVDTSFTNDGFKVAQLAGCHVKGERDGSNNLTVTWLRRARIAPEWTDRIDVALDITVTGYEVDVIDNSAVVRTITSSTSTVTEVEYTAAQQTDDGLTPGDPVTVRIYQMSSIIGRGFYVEATI